MRKIPIQRRKLYNTAVNILSVENLSKTLRDEPLFENATFGLDEGGKAGIVGRNGAGKSTLLKVIAGYTVPDEGTVSARNGLNTVYLGQQVEFGPDATVRSFLYESDSPLIRTIREYEEAVEAGHESTHLLERIQDGDLWGIERSYYGYLGSLGADIGPERTMASLSGGEAKKAAVARALALRPELLLLDEPTNHLDIRSIEFLEDWISSTAAAVIIVTHDRHILTRCCSVIWELDRRRTYAHPGSFTSYLERREERYRMDEKEMQRILTILRREREWLLHGPKARTGKDKNRKDRIREMEDSLHKVREDSQKAFSSTYRRLGKKVLELDSVSKAYGGRQLFSPFTYSFKAGEHIGLIGDNGSGKSTFLNIITGNVESDTGMVDKGVNTFFGYYDQNASKLPDGKTVGEYAEELGSIVRLSGSEEVSSSRFLELFGFPVSMQRTPIGLLSGGERRRLYLITRLVQNPNFIILDEPTNDLDIGTMENLEQCISSFQGTVIISSHDRTFLDMTTDMLLVIEDGAIRLFPGTYSDWKEARDASPVQAAEKKEKRVERKEREKKGLTFREEREKAQLEEEISVLEAEIKELEESFAIAGSTELGTLKERTELYQAKTKLLEEKSERWFELEEKASS